jgi:PAS domain S-box-containing protein
MLPIGRNLREWLLLALALLLAVGLVVYEGREERQQILAAEQTRLTTLSQVVQQHIGRQIESIDLTLRSLREQLPQGGKGGEQETSRLLQVLADAMPGVRNILVLDAAGQVTASNSSAFIGKNFSKRDYFRIPQADANSDTLYFAAPFRNSLGIWTIPLVRVIPDEKGRFAGIVAASIEAQEIASMLDAVRYAPEVWTAVVHEDGRAFVARPEPEDMQKLNVRADADSLVSRHLASGQNFSLQTGMMVGLQTSESLLAMRNLLPSGIKTDKILLLGVGRSTTSIFARWRREMLQHGMELFVLICGAAGMLHFVQRRRREHESSQTEYQAHLERTVEKRTEQLASSEQQLRLILESTGDGLIGMDVHGTMTFINPAACTLLGYTAPQLLGNNVHSTLHYRHADGRPYPAAECGLLRHIIAGKVTHLRDDVFWRADGRPLHVSVATRPIFQGEKVIGGVISFTDNTERHQIELAREQARLAAEAANRAKTAFLANMSHELRTPMTAIMGMTRLALRRTTDPQLCDPLDKIDQASNHLLSIINSVLDISKIESERFTLEETSFRLDEVTHKVDTLMAAKAREVGLAFTIDLPPGLASLSLSGDPLRLGQVLLNLAGNAIKFTEQGTVQIRATLAADDPAAVTLRFDVIDTGIGIAAEDQSRLFSAFEQTDNSMTRKYGGTGLGLAISRQLVHLMGGEIGLQSTPGQGSTFWFTCRLGKAASAVPPAPTLLTAGPSAHPAFPGKRVLLAEDEPISQEVLRGLLEDAGLTVVVAADGAAAVALARAGRYDLVLMDMQMPIMNGLDATRALRALPGYADIPILATTANAFAEDRQACLAAGMDDHISKPINPAHLYAELARYLS